MGEFLFDKGDNRQNQPQEDKLGQLVMGRTHVEFGYRKAVRIPEIQLDDFTAFENIKSAGGQKEDKSSQFGIPGFIVYNKAYQFKSSDCR